MPFRILPLILLASAVSAAVSATPFSVCATSPRAGLLFTDSEKVDVRVAAADAPGPVAVDYTVTESDGPWHTAGKLALRGAETPLPLKLPGRGLYRLNLSARSGEATATAEAWVAVVFTPGQPDPASPWGIFYAPPEWFMKDLEGGSKAVALSHRLLGASWSRLNFWAESFGKVTVTPGATPPVTYDKTRWMMYAKDLRAQGISIFGEIAQCPRPLSSRPNDEAVSGDAGSVYGRVKPADYAVWDSLMTQVAADFREEIPVWEIWNEANLTNGYWVGTPEDFCELVQHTSASLKRGNPKARIAAAGIVHGHDFADKLLTLGMGKSLDILTVHYTDASPSEIPAYKALLRKHNLDLPIWNSEEASEVPLENMAGGIERSFKFIHVAIGYPELRPLIRRDLTVLPAGILFSVGAHCLGSAKFVERTDKVPGWNTLFFRRGDETIAAFRGVSLASAFGGKTSVTLAVEPLVPGKAPTLTDYWGRSTPVKIVAGKATIALADKYGFLNGCRKLRVISAETVGGAGAIFEAEAGKWSDGWAASAKDGFSGGKVVEIWQDKEPGPDGYWAELKLNVPTDGRYDVVFSGNTLTRLAPPRSLSPFVWTLDGGEEHSAESATPFTEVTPGLPDAPSLLGTVPMKQGEHTFRLRLTAPREAPDKYYAMWFDAILLRPSK